MDHSLVHPQFLAVSKFSQLYKRNVTFNIATISSDGIIYVGTWSERNEKTDSRIERH